MNRLHSFVKRGEPYPEQFRYGPGRMGVQNSHSNRASHMSSPSNNSADVHIQGSDAVAYQPVTVVSGQSEVDKLFARLQPPHSISTPQPNVAQAPSRSVQSWFAALAGQDLPAQNNINAANVSSSSISSMSSQASV